jgi:N-glycosylase/DNA lyase
MKLKIHDDFDLKKIAESGQCFRFNECGEGFGIVAKDKFLYIKKTGECEYEADCDKAEFEGFWSTYFDLDTDYRKIRSLIDRDDDEYLYNASEFGKGIRILRQDPWEMLISFIISQRKNIPAIKASIEKICALAGEKIATDPDGRDIYSFPEPKQLAKLSVSDLGSCSLGYRDKYVYQAAQDVASGAVKLESWETVSDEALMQSLLGLYGVGVKVANCEILFGYHRLDAFPKDVWINRVLEQHYKEGFPFERYAPYNGVMQQYLFFYSRSLQ